MKPLDWVIIAVIVICTLLCIRRIRHGKGSCSCGAGGSCGSCASCGGKCEMCGKNCKGK